MTEITSAEKDPTPIDFAQVRRARSRRKVFAGTGRIVFLNRILASYLVVLIAFDIFTGRSSHVVLDAVLSLPFAALLLIAATRIVRGTPLSKAWLRVSGWTCFALALVAGLAILTSFEEPLNVPWVLLAGALFLSMLYAAWYQLWRAPRNVSRDNMIERVRRGFKREAA